MVELPGVVLTASYCHIWNGQAACTAVITLLFILRYMCSQLKEDLLEQ